MNFSRLRDHIRRDEGVRYKPYQDTEGVLTVGVGRNIQSVPFSEDEVELMFSNDLRSAHKAARRFTTAFAFLNDARQEVLVNMAFNLGGASLATFKLFKAAIERGDFHEAARQMEDSKWHEQVGDRAKRLIKQMESGAIE